MITTLLTVLVSASMLMIPTIVPRVMLDITTLEYFSMIMLVGLSLITVIYSNYDDSCTTNTERSIISISTIDGITTE